jgi:hypothetical protein
MERLAAPALAAVLLAVATLPAPAAAAEDDLQVTLPERRVGDRSDVHVRERVQLVLGGEVVSFQGVEEQTHTFELREMGLEWGDRRTVLVDNITLPNGDPFPNFRNIRGLATSTGEVVVSPYGFASAGIFTATSSILGTIEFQRKVKDTYTPSQLVHEPHTRLQEIVGDETLTVGTNVTEVVDHRPRFDLVERHHLNVTGQETVNGTPTLEAHLETERLEDGSWTESGLPATLWLADDRPVPLRTKVSVEGEYLEYDLTRNVTSFARGDRPVPWGQGEAPLRDGPVEPYERGALTGDGPPDGDAADHPFPLSDAVTWAKLLPTADGFQRFRLTHPDAVLVGAAFQTVEDAPEGTRHVWTLVYADQQDAAAVQVSRHVPDEPADEAAVHTSEDRITFVDGFPVDRLDGQPVLTLGQMADLQDRYAREDETDRVLAFGLGLDGDGELTMPTLLVSSNVTEGESSTFRSTGQVQTRGTLLDGRNGEATDVLFYEAWSESTTRLDLPPAAEPIADALPDGALVPT